MVRGTGEERGEVPSSSCWCELSWSKKSGINKKHRRTGWMLERTADVIQEMGGSGALGPQPPGEQEVQPCKSNQCLASWPFG